MEEKRMADSISKHDAYTTLKDLEAAYIYPPVKEAHATAARRIDQIKPADVQPVNQWISVDDKLPDTVDDCLVWYSCDTAFGKSKSVGISFCSRDDWYKKHLNGDNIVVLYWMPLPEPPKDGDTE
jgi:hypothetical protein